MDRLVRRLSTGVARTTTRRGFLGQMTRLLAGVAVGAAGLYGGAAFALPPKCVVQTDGTCNYGTTNNGGYTWCSGGDGNGCGGVYVPGTSDVNYCTDCANGTCNSTGPNSVASGSWTCCCNSNTLTTCTDCGPAQNDISCICLHKGDPNLGC